MHQDGEVLAPRNVGLFRISLDFCKITQVLQTLLGNVHPDGVKDVSGRNEHFAPNDLVLGARIPFDADPVYKRANALLDIIMYIDQSGTGWRPFRLDHKIDVAAAAVSIGNRLCVIAQLLRRINTAFLHF